MHPKPIVVLSKCLELDACRYNAMSIRSNVVRALLPHIDVRPICPEVEIGLGVPRQPIRLVSIDQDVRLVQPSTNRDFTDEMRDFSDQFLAGNEDVDGFILKNRSPSCGIKDTKIHAASAKPGRIGKGAGVFGGAVLERFGHAAIEDEGRLTDFRLRHHFLTKLFLRARFRVIQARGTMASLVRFHAANRFLLLAYHQTATRTLGRIVANHERRTVSEVLGAYERELARALERPARRAACAKILERLLGHFGGSSMSKERARFLAALSDYRADRVTLEVPLSILRQWSARRSDVSIAHRTYLDPYPRKLMTLDNG